MKNLIYLIIFLVGSTWLQGQDIALSYEVKTLTESHYTLQIYMQSMSDQDKAVSAVNFSMALPEGCLKVTGQESIFADRWTNYLEEVKTTPNLNLLYGNWQYSHRWQYGNADPGLPNTTSVVAPSQQRAPLKIMELVLEGTCTDQLYMEQQHENRLNQMADGTFKSIPWTVIHPKTELAIQEDVLMKIYPNPVSDLLNINFEGKRENVFLLELFSIDGKRLMTREVDAKEQNALTMNLSELPSAVYWLAISAPNADGDQVKQVKIIKK